MKKKPKLNKTMSDFTEKERNNIMYNRDNFDNKDIFILIISLYKK